LTTEGARRCRLGDRARWKPASSTGKDEAVANDSLDALRASADRLAATIVTERLRLVPLVVDDADEMVTVLGDERMYEFTGGCPPSLAALRERYRHLVIGHSADGSEHWLNWVVRLEDVAVGVMQATVAADGSSADVAWEVGVAWQGLGIASEAASAVVDWLAGEGVDTIAAYIHPEHHASGRVAAHAGLSPTTELVDGETMWRRVGGSKGPTDRSVGGVRSGVDEC
jgi:RimJ/RimL family protein N-acetyltransferase